MNPRKSTSIKSLADAKRKGNIKFSKKKGNDSVYISFSTNSFPHGVVFLSENDAAKMTLFIRVVIKMYDSNLDVVFSAGIERFSTK